MSFPTNAGPNGPQFNRPVQSASSANSIPPPVQAPPKAPRRAKNVLFSRPLIGIVALVVGFLGGAGAQMPASEAAPAVTTTATVTHESTVEATVTATATAVTTVSTTQQVTVTASPPEEPAFTVVPGEYRELTEREFKLIAKDPDKYTGDQVTIYGEVFQFDSATGSEAFLARAGGAKQEVSDYGYTDFELTTMFSGAEELLEKVVEGDVFEAQVNVIGSYSYDTQAGGNTTVPLLGVVAITVYDSVD